MNGMAVGSRGIKIKTHIKSGTGMHDNWNKEIGIVIDFSKTHLVSTTSYCCGSKDQQRNDYVYRLRHEYNNSYILSTKL